MSSISKPIAFLILAHADPDQLARLARALDYRSRIFIHLDAKSDLAEFRRRTFPSCASFLGNRVRVSWAAFSSVEAIICLMRAALSSGESYSHLVFLSGLDYPIKPMRKLHEFLNSAPQREHICFTDASLSRHYPMFFEHYWFLETIPGLPRKFERNLRHGFGRALRPFLKKPQPSSMVPCWGSAYWALTPQCVNHILEFTDKRPDYVRWARSSYAPDEHYFHTIVGNSSFLSASDGFIPCEGNKTYKMANLHLIDPSLRKVRTEEDLREILNSDKFFVRKLTSGQSKGLLDILDQDVLTAVQ
jgi:hypothetical protein